MAAHSHRVVLASRSPARLHLLRAAGLDPQVVASGADETRLPGERAEELTARLAQLKAESVLPGLDLGEPTVVIACDSVLDLDGQVLGKPHSVERAVRWWTRMRGRSGVLVTGHHVVVDDEMGRRSATRIGSTVVTFADLTDEEIAAYAATGEPVSVAGAFTLDGRGAAFVTRIVGDPHNVSGLSISLLRQVLVDLDVPWQGLWS